MPYGITDMVLYFFLYSFLGWAQETVQCIHSGKALYQPRIFKWSALSDLRLRGAADFHLSATCQTAESRRPWLSVPWFFCAERCCFGAGICHVLGLMEKLFHARWWDYSDKKWNINGRICFWISVGWGLLAAIFVFGIQPFF